MRESSEFFVQAITVTKNAFTSTAGALCAAGEQGWGALRFTLCCWPEAGVWAVRLKPSLAGFAQGNWGRMKPTNNWICSDFSCHLCQFKKSEPVNEPQPSAFGSCCISLKGLRWKAVGLLACFLIKLFLLSGTILLFFFFFPRKVRCAIWMWMCLWRAAQGVISSLCSSPSATSMSVCCCTHPTKVTATQLQWDIFKASWNPPHCKRSSIFLSNFLMPEQRKQGMRVTYPTLVF